MDCFEEGFLQMYIDGEVSEEGRKLIEDHLNNCEACQSKLDEQRAQKSSVLAAINLLAESAEEHEKPHDIKVRPLPIKEFYTPLRQQVFC